MNGHHHFVPGVMATTLVEDQVHSSDGETLEVLPPELTRESILLPEGPVLVLAMHGQHWGVVTDLLISRGGETEKRNN